MTTKTRPEVSGKQRFEMDIEVLILRECRRRKTGTVVVLSPVVRVANNLGEARYPGKWWYYEKERI